MKRIVVTENLAATYYVILATLNPSKFTKIEKYA